MTDVAARCRCPGNLALRSRGLPRAAATRTRHPEQSNARPPGNAAYWDSFWDAEQVFNGHVLGFKGLERRAVVQVVNYKSALERSRRNHGRIALNSKGQKGKVDDPSAPAAN